MAKHIDYTGQTIGRLTFLECETRGKKRFWKVKCQCGNEQFYRADYISVMKCVGRKFECYECKSERKSPTLTDKKFGRLTVIGESESLDNHHRWWWCRCDCGVEKAIKSISLLGQRGEHATKSCGCLARKLNSKWVNTTQYPPSHGLKSKETQDLLRRLYYCRNRFVAACYREEDAAYKIHGKKGHTVCDLWRNGAQDFVKWALENGYQKSYGIFLKEGKTEFSGENCFFQPKEEFHKINNSKFIEWNGKIKSITQWSQELGCTISCISQRLKKFKKYGIDKIMDLSWIPERTQTYGTEHLQEEIVRLYQEGKTFMEIGKELNCSSGPIGRFLKKNGIKARPAKCRSSLK